MRSILATRMRRICHRPLYFLYFALLLIFACPNLAAVESGKVDFNAIYEQAGFASAAYQSAGRIRAYLEPIDYTLTLYRTLPDIQISFFLATNEKTGTQVISVRGTSNIKNAMVDILLKLRPDESTGIQLHEGFALAARQVYAATKPLLRAGYKIRTTGHSLGGAVALILALYLDKDRFDVDQIVTFGQPKVTNLAGVRKITHLDILRVVTPLDVVPLMPPLDPLDINNLDVYWHAGREVVLLSDNKYAILEGLESMLRATRFTQQAFTEENIKSHNLSFYLGMIDAKKKSPMLVPYKTNLDLFNLFGSE